MFDSYDTFMFQPRITDEDVKKAYNKLIGQYGIVRKGACLMSDAKRIDLRKKRKKKNK